MTVILTVGTEAQLFQCPISFKLWTLIVERSRCSNRRKLRIVLDRKRSFVTKVTHFNC